MKHPRPRTPKKRWSPTLQVLEKQPALPQKTIVVSDKPDPQEQRKARMEAERAQQRRTELLGLAKQSDFSREKPELRDLTIKRFESYINNLPILEIISTPTREAMGWLEDDFATLRQRLHQGLVDLTPSIIYPGSVNSVQIAGLEKVLEGAGLSHAITSALAASAWKSVLKSLIDNPGVLYDPILQLQFPPEPRVRDYRTRPNVAKNSRMSLEVYLDDIDIGWGLYTRKSAMASFWLQDLDRPLHLAMIYQAEKQARAAGHLSKHAKSAAIDAWFLERGVMTTAHLAKPPAEIEWQAKILNFVRKLEIKHTGARQDQNRDT